MKLPRASKDFLEIKSSSTDAVIPMAETSHDESEIAVKLFQSHRSWKVSFFKTFCKCYFTKHLHNIGHERGRGGPNFAVVGAASELLFWEMPHFHLASYVFDSHIYPATKALESILLSSQKHQPHHHPCWLLNIASLCTLHSDPVNHETVGALHKIQILVLKVGKSVWKSPQLKWSAHITQFAYPVCPRSASQW